MPTQGAQFYTSLTATTSGGSVSFAVAGATGIPLLATRVTVVNTGASGAVYVNFTSTTGATTGDVPVNAGSSEQVTINARRGHYSGLSYVTATGGSVAFKVIAIR